MSVQHTVHEAQLCCSNGSTPARLLVTSQLFVTIKDRLIATEGDILPLINIPSFGSCRKGIYPTPCVPAPQPWQKTTVKENINGLKKLTMDSFCMCAQGGKISFVDAGINNFVDSE